MNTKVARILGGVVLLLAWSAAAIEYSRSGRIQWALLAAGVFVAAMPFAAGGSKSSR